MSHRDARHVDIGSIRHRAEKLWELKVLNVLRVAYSLGPVDLVCLWRPRVYMERYLKSTESIYPIHSMYGIYAYIDPPNHPNVGIWQSPGAFGYLNLL